MELRDFIVTPIVLLTIYALAYWIRPQVSDINTKRYFIPALTVKIIGAIAVGLVYQFYYGGGDTFTYHTHGSRVIWEAFMDNPVTGLKLFLNYPITEGVYSYAHKIWYYNDSNSFTVIQIATIFDLVTFSSYSSTAVLFAVFSFSGVWALYLTFYSKYKNLHLGLALAVLFVPTVFFWGSGILKDTITLGCLGWATYCFHKVVIQRTYKLPLVFIFILTSWVIYSIKIYILLSFLPAVFIWYYLAQIHLIRSVVLRFLIAPFLLFIIGGLSYLAVKEVGEDDPRYELDQLAETAKITAYDIGFYTGRSAGSGYNLGTLDGSMESMLLLAPAAINVALFRPYLWEIRNPLMLLSALESLTVLLFTVWVIFGSRLKLIIRSLVIPEVFFCLLFSLVFAFAVGISTYNFGTLSRYKIPLLPFYISAIVIIRNQSKRERKTLALDALE